MLWMKLITVGDNVVDCYLEEKQYYPGGNAVNVAVNAKRSGTEQVSYIGIFGNDNKAHHIKNCLQQEKIDFSRSRNVYAPSAQPSVTLDKDGDRMFIPGPKNSSQHLFKLKLTTEDLEFISGFDVCHTSCYSSLEDELSKIAENCQISFDFSENTNINYIKKIAPYINYAFFSGSHLLDKEIKSLQTICHDCGTEIVGITLGSRGATFSRNHQHYRQTIKKVNVIDTMGAGDSFIAGFLTSYTKKKDIQQALDFAAERAAVTCTQRGAFGYPHPVEEELLSIR